MAREVPSKLPNKQSESSIVNQREDWMKLMTSASEKLLKRFKTEKLKSKNYSTCLTRSSIRLKMTAKSWKISLTAIMKKSQNLRPQKILLKKPNKLKSQKRKSDQFSDFWEAQLAGQVNDIMCVFILFIYWISCFNQRSDYSNHSRYFLLKKKYKN